MKSLFVLFLSIYVTCVASQQPIVIDDSSEYSPQNPNGIQYFGSGWLTNNTNYNYLRYNGTSHAARAIGNGFVFSFRGTAISWYADRGMYSGPITLQLDGATASVSNYAPSIVFQQELWRSPTLDEGDHQIVVTNTGSELIGVDSLAITPNSGSNDIRPTGLGPGASSVPSDGILVDDSDSSVTWSGSGWQSITGGFMHGSARTTKTPGDSCTFTFTGVQFWYFVNDVSQNAPVDINVDGKKMYNGASDTAMFIQKLLWTSPVLSDQKHTVTITHAGNTGDSASLEFFMYLPSGSTSATDPGNSGTSTSTSKPTSTAAIVGGSIGGVVVLALVLGALFVWYNRRRKREPDEPKDASYPTYQAVPLEEGAMASWPQPAHFDHRSSTVDSPPAYQPSFSMGGGTSARTNLGVPGYTGHPEVQI